MLGAVDGGMGQDKREGDMTPLLAMLVPLVVESWLERRGIDSVGDGDLGSPGVSGAKSSKS